MNQKWQAYGDEDDTMNIELAMLLNLISGALGAGITFGGLRMATGRNSSDIGTLIKKLDHLEGAESPFANKDNCRTVQQSFNRAISNLETAVDKHAKCTRRLENWALYQMTVKDGMTLPEARKVLENGG
jgi:hypothetical protein